MAKRKKTVSVKAPEKQQEELWGADPNCKHVIYAAPGGGIKCKKCPGWFCY